MNENEGNPVVVDGGVIYTYPYDGDKGTNYQVFVPNDYNPNTVQVNYYIPGGNGNFVASSRDIILGTSPNSIVVFPSYYSGVNHTDAERVASDIQVISKDIIDRFGVKSGDFTVEGASNGGICSLETLIYSLKSDDNVKFNTSVILDGYYGFGYNSNKRSLTEEEVKLLKQNNCTIFAFQQEGVDADRYQTDYASQGVNVIKVASLYGHEGTNNEVLRNGLINYLNGTGDFNIPTSNGKPCFVFQRYDSSTGTWVNVAESEINTLVKLTSNNINVTTDGKIVAETLESSNTLLHDYVLDIHTEINNTNASIYNHKAYDNSTSTPQNIEDQISKLFNANFDLLSDLIIDTNYLLQIGDKIDELDEKMKERLNSFIQVEEQETGTTGGLKGFFSSIGDFIDHNKEILIVGTVGGAVLGYAFVAAKVGATLGTAIAPGVGTAVGAVIGLGVGCVIGAVSSWISSIRQSNSSTPDTTSTPDSNSSGGTDSGESSVPDIGALGA